MLELVFGLLALGEDHQSGCVTVEAVDNEEFVARLLPLQIFEQYAVGRSVLYLVNAH